MERKILIVDSNSMTRKSLAHQLRHVGCEFVEAENLLEANRVTGAYGIEVALIDLDSLRSEALLILQMIKNIQADSEVILLTGTETIPLAIRGMKMGAFDDLIKPVAIEALLSKIRLARDKIKKKKRNTIEKGRSSKAAKRSAMNKSNKENENGKI